jgi:uncharacterized protein YhhL (DUF1145 family)
MLLTVLGAVLVIALTNLVTPAGVSHWKYATILCVVVGAVHAVSFLILNRRQRAARLRTIQDMQMMLNDIINNQLAVIQTAAALHEPESEQARAALLAITRSVTAITESLQHLSDDSLREWQIKYPHRIRPGS